MPLSVNRYSAAVLIVSATACTTVDPAALERGRRLAFDRHKGNCLACHQIEDGESPGNIGPPLTHLETRFTDKEQLKEQIRDATQFNSETSMPPFGRNGILSDEELNRIVDYLWSLD